MTEPVLSYHIQLGTHPRRLSGLSGILRHDMSQQKFRRRSTPIHVQALRGHLQLSAQQKIQNQKRQKSQKLQGQKRQQRDQQRRLSRRGDRRVAFSGGRGFFRFRTGGLHHNSNTPRPHRHTDRRCALTAHPSTRPSGRTPRPWGNRNSRKYRTENQ